MEVTDSQLVEFFLANTDLFNNNNIFFSALRTVGWLIVKGFVFLADITEDLYDTAFGLVDFTTWTEGTEFMNAFKPVFIALMAVSLFALGIMLMMGKDKRPKIVQNICIACLCVTCSTVVFAELNALTVSFKDGVEGINAGGKGYDGAYDIVSENLYDLVYLDSQLGMKNINYEENKDALPHPDINKKSFSVIDYDEIINYDTERFSWKAGGEAKTILKSELISTGDEYTIGEVYNGIGWQSGDEDDLLNEFYYRYKFDFFPALITLGAVIIVYLAMAYKVVRLIIELFVGKLLAYLFSAELSGGQKITEILVFIRNTYFLLLLTTILIRIFYFAITFCQSRINNTLVECIIILFVAFVIIDGPNIVERLLGMDIGLSSSTARIFAAYHTMKAAAHTAASPVRWGVGKAAEHHRMNKYFGGGNNGSERSDKNVRADEGRSGSTDRAFMDNGGSGNSSYHDSKTDQRSDRHSDQRKEADRAAHDRSERASDSQLHTDSRTENAAESREINRDHERNTDFMDQTMQEKESEYGRDTSFMNSEELKTSPAAESDRSFMNDRQKENKGADGAFAINSDGRKDIERKKDHEKSGASGSAQPQKAERSSFMDRRKTERKSAAPRTRSRYDSDLFRARKDDRGKDR